ncbi:MAG: dsRBD fold-containing protein [Actinomycetes bacterium]
MQASAGDHIIVAATKLNGPVRDGQVLATGPGGGPPYTVRWSDSGQETLFFPGSDAYVEAAAGTDPTDGSAAGGLAESARRTKSWRVDVHLYEGPDQTSAQAVLHSDVPLDLQVSGTSRRNPRDTDVPEIGDEVAVARALRGLADRLLATASDDIAGQTGHPVHLTS